MKKKIIGSLLLVSVCALILVLINESNEYKNRAVVGTFKSKCLKMSSKIHGSAYEGYSYDQLLFFSPNNYSLFTTVYKGMSCDNNGINDVALEYREEGGLATIKFSEASKNITEIYSFPGITTLSISDSPVEEEWEKLLNKACDRSIKKGFNNMTDATCSDESLVFQKFNSIPEGIKFAISVGENGLMLSRPMNFFSIGSTYAKFDQERATQMRFLKE